MAKYLTNLRGQKMCATEKYHVYATAYLNASKVLARNTVLKKNSYPNVLPILFLMNQGIELFLKWAILKRSSITPEHDIFLLAKKCKQLYPEVEMTYFREFLDCLPGQTRNLKTGELESSFDPVTQVYRYPEDNKGRQWKGVYAFSVVGFVRQINALIKDFKRLKTALKKSSEKS